MKKLLAVLMIGILAVSCTACGEESSTDDTKGNSKTSTSDKADTSEDEENGSAKSTVTPEEILYHEVSPESDFSACVGINDDSMWGICGYNGTDEIVVIPETVDGKTIKFVEQYCFSNRNSEKVIVFPDTVEKLNNTSCALNEGVETVILGRNTKSIEEGAFLQCKSLKNIQLNQGLEKIGTIAFSMCESLESIYIPESVTTIESGAFTMIEDSVVIHGKAGSAAEEYAKSENIQFVAE